MQVSDDVFEHIRATYANYGLPLQRQSITSPEAFQDILKTVEHRLAEISCRMLPAGFDADAHTRAFPHHPQARWASCEEAIRAYGASGVLMRLPLFWQLESPLHAACRGAGAFILVNDRANMPVGAQALKAGEISAIVTDTADAEAFSSYLTQHGYTLERLWILVDAPGRNRIPSALTEPHIQVRQEVHIFPGLPTLVQCATLAEEKGNRFHVADLFTAESTEEGFLITSTAEIPLPLYRYLLPLRLEKDAACLCGKDSFCIKT